ncbi:uncharacterized protein TNIN_76601 [Trichonephila inaurata madagascariensis]|uniref:Uncharacterized protein n=1 Tax=Trichonephila inaurata madagascariensis TaxID=2747483 RepID=A0A8X7C0S2_9ARAC|nr:uncharacterized protein TNIN_76601 [Trichonephila inaurata madagascariensis]
MQSLLPTVVTVVIVVLSTTSFTPVTCRKDIDKRVFHPSVLYTVSILTDEQRADQDIFVDTFVQAVHDSDTLMDLFDLTESTSVEVSHFAEDQFKDTLALLGATHPEKIANFATRPMDNAKDLAKQYANFFEKSAKDTVVEGDPSSKFPAISNGFLQYLKSIETLTADNGWKVAIYYESEWLLTAAETPDSRDLFVKCSAEANGDPN